MSLADQRRASGARNEAARRAIGTAITAARQSTFKQDLNSLETNSARKGGALRVKEQPGARGATRGQADYSPQASTGGGGIASPLTEQTKLQTGQPVADRQYYPAGLVSSDGLLVLPATKKLTFTDANGAEVVLDFATPGTLP